VLNLFDTTSVLIFFSWMASTQLAHTLLQRKQSLYFVLTASLLCLTTGVIYGFTVALIEVVVAPLQILQPQPLHSIHLIAMVFVFCIWIGLNLKPLTHHERSVWWRRFYVSMLNSSQPDPKTMTSNKNEYKF
jgi:NAD(P)H-quinone oxidoreductase subunit 5